MSFVHGMPFGAEVIREVGVRFRLWAPAQASIGLVLEDQATIPMQSAEDGWFELTTDKAGPGSRYQFQLDDGLRVADPASRFQPDGVHGSSLVVDPEAYDWQADWAGRPWQETVLYELHLGTFSEDGTFDGLRRRLDHLVNLGITALELMPIAAFAGSRGWGYDGVLPFAPDSSYGRPDDLKALIDAAHARGLMVFLDVVYNHFGPEGNYLHSYAPQFFTERHHTPWGAAIDFSQRPVRDFFIHNALYWLEEYRFDGLRLDAVHEILDDSEPDILVELAETIRATVAPGRHVHLVLENDNNAARYLNRRHDGTARHFSAQWNDDFHHAAHTILTGEREGYYLDYADHPVDRLGRALAEGFIYQGQASPYRDNAPRGEPSADLPPGAFVNFLQNHDQIGNRAFGERLSMLAAPEALRALVALVLLAPQTPLLFMGEEWAVDTPFYYFCDYEGALADAVRDGRRREFAQFPEFADPASREAIPDPNALETFSRSRLDWSSLETEPGQSWFGFYRSLLQLRREALAEHMASIQPGKAWAERWGATGLTVVWPLDGGGRLCVMANLGAAAEAAGPKPAATPIFVSDDRLERSIADGHWPAWSCAWFLETSSDRTA